MSVKRSQLPFERLREKFDERDLRCRQCGFTDTNGNWRVRTSGSRVSYQFICPGCDAVETRELRL